MYVKMKKINCVGIKVWSVFFHCLALFIALLLPVTANTEDYLTTHLIELSGGIGYYDFDDVRNLDDAGMVEVGLGLHFSRRWAALLQYSALDTTSNVNGISKSYDVQRYHVDVYRFFNIEKHLRPYLVAGFGQMDLIAEGEDSNNMFNGGFGLYYRITPSWSVRADVRIFASTNQDYKDNALTFTMGYRFNGGERDSQ